MSLTFIIIIATSLISYFAFQNEKVYNDMMMSPTAIKNEKQWYRLITSGFIHADWQHLIFNMLTLYFFGRHVEGYLAFSSGTTSFLLLYFLGIIVSNIPSYIKHKNNYHFNSLGASGGVSAVLFSFIVFQPLAKINFIPGFLAGIIYVAYSTYMSKKGGDNINHDAHLWGAIFGFVFTIILDTNNLHIFLTQLGFK